MSPSRFYIKNITRIVGIVQMMWDYMKSDLLEYSRDFGRESGGDAAG